MFLSGLPYFYEHKFANAYLHRIACHMLEKGMKYIFYGIYFFNQMLAFSLRVRPIYCDT